MEDIKIDYIGNAGESSVPRSVVILAGRLAEIHGKARIAREKSGIHIYIPSPYALSRDGLKEDLA